MTDTEITLLAIHRTPMIPLKDICEKYFNLAYNQARVKALAHQLPIPCWRLVESQKAPLLVRSSDLASYIDTQSVEAQKAWRNSQT